MYICYPIKIYIYNVKFRFMQILTPSNYLLYQQYICDDIIIKYYIVTKRL